MTREEEIKKAVQEFKEERKTAIGRIKRGGWYFADIFEEGIKWADEHPKLPWVKIEDDLPCNHKDWIIQDGKYLSTRLCVVSDGINIFVNKMFNIDGVWKWGEIFEDVKFWFVVPSPYLN